MKKYQIAMYIRLSKEDDKKRCESNSITMQRILLQRFVAEHFSDYDLLAFCDDGYTGTNFERPGMQNMLEMVRNSEINCIVVKDFSRFARDYIKLGSYLEQIFPFMGVRFISVNDNYDSQNYQGSIADIDVNFKNLLYDLYSKDLSQKVRSSLAIRKEKGQYVSANSPFGYEKDPEDRHALLIAEDEAEIVRQIFSLTVEGYTSVEIAKLFNENRVKTPIEFKIEKGKTSREPKGERFLWSNSTICQILRNEIYVGNIVQKKYEKDFVGGRNHIKPREEWMVRYNHHEPIIDRNVFDKVQEGRGKKRNPQNTPIHPLVGKMVCGCCKKNLSYRKGLNPYFTCHHRYSSGMNDCVDQINVMFMEQYVLYKMQEKLQADGELEKLRIEAMVRIDKEIKELKNKRSLLSARIQKIKQQNFEAYQDYVSGKTDSFHSGEIMVKSIEDERTGLNDDIREMEAVYTKLECGHDSLNFGKRFAVLSKEMIEHYIDKIVVYDEKHIEIFWKEKADMA
ncbi:MAG: recombinase family protein [Lachnospiraceae bacterium]|nr:recombinase family protein [Lachnospiraceae bacterium]